jgi:hypothetical protein
MEAMLRISLYSYLYPKLEKTLSFLPHMFSLQQNQRRVGGRRSGTEMCTHVSKCTNEKIKGENKQNGSGMVYLGYEHLQQLRFPYSLHR